MRPQATDYICGAGVYPLPKMGQPQSLALPNMSDSGLPFSEKLLIKGSFLVTFSMESPRPDEHSPRAAGEFLFGN
jgi:hypothetical protein